MRCDFHDFSSATAILIVVVGGQHDSAPSAVKVMESPPSCVSVIRLALKTISGRGNPNLALKASIYALDEIDPWLLVKVHPALLKLSVLRGGLEAEGLAVRTAEVATEVITVCT